LLRGGKPGEGRGLIHWRDLQEEAGVFMRQNLGRHIHEAEVFVRGT